MPSPLAPAVSGPLRRQLEAATRRLLWVSTGMVSKATCDAACAGRIPWALTTPTDQGFLCYSHDERQEGGFDDLWAVIRFARAHDFDHVVFDADGDHLDTALTGLPHFDW